MTDKYEQLKQVIQAANPEIMELKFGCEVNLDTGESYGFGEIVREISICPKHKRWATCENNGFECSDEMENGFIIFTGNDEYYWERTVKKSEIKDYQILGRPIRLADVLLALQNNVRTENGIRMMDIKGTFALSDATNHVLMRWNPKDDNLDHQSEECKEFLIKLLVHEQTNQI